MVGALVIAAFVSEVIGTMAGFGSSTIFLPLALLLVDFKTALVLVAFLHIFGNATRYVLFRNALDRKLFAVFGVPSVIMTAAGAAFAAYAPQDILKTALGAFLVLYASVSLARPELRFTAAKSVAIIGGGASGFVAGLIGTGGALRSAFLTGFGLGKEAYIATAAMIGIVVDLTRLPVYLANGFLAPVYFGYVPLLLPVAIAGSYVGKRLIGKIPQRTFRTIVLGALILAGAKFVADGLNALL